MGYTWPAFPPTGETDFESTARTSLETWRANSVLLETRMDSLDTGTAGYSSNSIPGTAIQTGTITATQMGSNSVDSDEITNGAVTQYKYGNASLHYSKLYAINSPSGGDILSFNSGSGDFEWITVSAGGSTGLERITDGSPGWRLVGMDTDDYGDLGSDAVDLSISTGNSSTRGAVGNMSFATGKNTRASGDYSIVFGDTNIASGLCAVASGYNTEASNDYTAAFGEGTMAAYSGAFSCGNFNNGTNSSVVFEVGVGTGTGDRKDGFQVLTNGVCLMPQVSRSEIDSAGNAAVLSLGYLDDKGATGTFTSNDGKTITVDKGLIISIVT